MPTAPQPRPHQTLTVEVLNMQAGRQVFHHVEYPCLLDLNTRLSVHLVGKPRPEPPIPLFTGDTIILTVEPPEPEKQEKP